MVGMAAGLTNRQLAQWTGWTEGTVETYLKNLNAKLAIHRRGQANQLIVMELLNSLELRQAVQSAPLGGGKSP